MATNSPVFPNGIVTWSNRADRVNTVFANDPNSLAAEVISIENTLGTNPQIESAPPYGNAVTYANAGARIHDVQQGTQKPYVSLTNPSFTVKNQGGPPMVNTLNSYNVRYDPWGYYNGTDITIPVPGLYTITMNQIIGWAESGFFHADMWINGTEVADAHWSWDFPENGPNGVWGTESHLMSITWQGVIQAGVRITITSTNNTSVAQCPVRSAFLRAAWDREMPTSVPTFS